MKDKKEIMKLRKIIKISAIVAMSLSLSTLNAASNHIGYQGIAFDDGSALVEQNISLRFTVYQNNGSTVVYQETKTGIKTTDKGFFSHKIGSGVKSSSSPLWSSVVWNDNYKLKVEIDKNNGTSFVNLGTQDLISVAYAKKSENASSATTLSGLTSSVAELNHVDGVSSNIQTQLNGKATKSFSANPSSHRAAIITPSGKLSYLTNITSTKLGYLNTVTSPIQTQLNNKLSSTENAVSATKLKTARKIGGVSFDGSADINLPGVNTAGTQNTSGNSATATKLKTARTINGKSFDGSTNVTKLDPYIDAENTTDGTKYLTFSTSSTAGYKRIRTDENLQYNPSTNTLTASIFSGKATTLKTETDTTNATRYIPFISSSNTDAKFLRRDSALNYNPSTDVLTVPKLNIGGTTATHIYDEDDMTSNSASALVTQQSIKAYVDSAVSGVDTSSLLPKSGGTVTGDIDMGAENYIRYSSDTNDYFGWYANSVYNLDINSKKILTAYKNGVVINQDAESDIVFRVESANKEGMFRVDPTNEKVGIGKTQKDSTLNYTLDVEGTVGISSTLSAKGGIKLGAEDYISYSSDANDFFWMA